ncbi:MAG: hypothetical protein GY765_05225 [bacterium]|nr:hypothetical protein [bacterium]
MQSRTLNKTCREFFLKHAPVYTESTAEQKSIINSLKEKIKEKKEPGVSLDETSRRYYYGKEHDSETCLSLNIGHPDSGWYDRAGIEIAFEKEDHRDKLCIKPRFEKHSYNFSGKAADLMAFIDVVREKFREIENKKTKSEKIKKLKKSAILAGIKELAKKNKFNFYLEELRARLRLSVQIGEKGIVTMDISYSKFQQEMAKIEIVIANARELYQSGIVVKLNFKSPNNAHQLRQFTKYDTL